MKHFEIKLNGIGLHCGKGVIVDKENKLHGDTFNVAYTIGEDLVGGGKVLLSSDVKAIIDKDQLKNALKIEKTVE
jgi:hypothetical protein